MLLFLSGCLLLADPPEGAVCDDADCAPYRCADYGNECEDYCSDDDECADGLICDLGDCEEPCAAVDCPGGFQCSEYQNECNDYCIDDNDCQAAYHCCDLLTDDNCDPGECVQ